MFSSKTEPENTWVRVMGTSCADGSAGLMRPGGGLSTSSAGGRRPARGAQADRLGDGVAQAGRPERLLQRERQRVVEGKSVADREDLGGRRNFKKKNHHRKKIWQYD